MFQVSLKRVGKWWATWLAGGRGVLAAQPRGRRVGEHQLLSEIEQQAVLDHRPCDVGLAGQLWTRAGVGNLIGEAEVMCRFLDRLGGHIEHKVHLVLDGHFTHRSRKVRAWLAAHPDRIEPHFLPSYPPELHRRVG